MFRYFLPKSKHYREKPEFNFSQLQVQNAIDGLINGSIASSIWLADFRAALDERPELAMYAIPMTNGCDGCNKYDRTATKQAIVTVSLSSAPTTHMTISLTFPPSIQGRPYDHDTLLDDSDEEDAPAQTFDLGRFCAEKAHFHHSLKRESLA